MKECSKCRSCYEDTLETCPLDGNLLAFTIAGGTVISGRYILEQRLGQGGMGIVFKARHKFLKSSHAIKIILPSLVSGDESLLVRFRQEAVLSASIDHPNVIRVTDFGVEHDNMPYLVMEFVDGTPLSHFLTEGNPLSFERAYELFLPIALGVGQAHRKGIIHRDLKPPNIMVQKNLALRNAVKVLDFGLAKIKSVESYPSLIQAQTQNVMGSPPYMSPEQWSGEDIDHRTDIYALGVIFYQMLAGRLPYQSESMPGMMYQHLTAPLPALGSFGITVSPFVESVLQKALAKDPHDRYATIEAMVTDIGESARGLVSSPDIMGAATEYMIPPIPSDSGIPRPPTSPNQFSDSQKQRLSTFFDGDATNLNADPKLARDLLEAQDRFEMARTQAIEADVLLQQLEEAEKRAEEAQQKALQAKQQIEADVRRQVEAEMEKLVFEERSKREAEARRLTEEAAARKIAEDRANYLAQAALDAQRQAEAERARRQEESQQRQLHEGGRRQAEIEAQQLTEQVAEAKRQYEEARKRAESEAHFRSEAEARRQQIESELQAAFRSESERRKLIEVEAQKQIHDQAERYEREAIAAKQHLDEARALTDLESKKREEAEAARLAAEREVNRLAEEIAVVQQRMDRMQESIEAEVQRERSRPDLAIPEPGVSGDSRMSTTLPSHVEQTQGGQSATSLNLPHGLIETGSFGRTRRLWITALAGVVSVAVLAGLGTGAYFLLVPAPPPANNSRPPVEVPPPSRDMAQIKGGTFLMGRSDVPDPMDPEWGNQFPQHSVELPDFYLDKHEASNAQYAEFTKDTGHPVPASWKNGTFPKGTANLPVTDVSLADATAYAGWVSKRLKRKCTVPTEEQWEYAARNGPKATAFPWGGEWRKGSAVLSGAPAAVGSSGDRTPESGISDMLGNVSEWTSSKYSLYTDHPGDKSLDKEYISVRGLNWKTPDHLLDKPEMLLTYRNYLTADQKNPYVGFRLACDP
ncbi:MAG: SUMF1/EgtB/PvdO family nonheme iron enzyme [Pyrinomonadaceae bacterium]